MPWSVAVGGMVLCRVAGVAELVGLPADWFGLILAPGTAATERLPAVNGYLATSGVLLTRIGMASVAFGSDAVTTVVHHFNLYHAYAYSGPRALPVPPAFWLQFCHISPSNPIPCRLGSCWFKTRARQFSSLMPSLRVPALCNFMDYQRAINAICR